MQSADEVVALRVVDALNSSNLVEAKNSDKFLNQLIAGKMSSEDWTLLAEAAVILEVKVND